MPRALRTLALPALLLAAAACGGSEPPRPEHVLLIVVDTLRADHLSAWGYGRATSPAMDELARGGARFERAFAQSSWTSPSMVSLLTGRYVAEDRLHVPEDAPTLAEAFQRRGFATAAFITNDILSESNGFRRGFERFEQLQPYAPYGEIHAWLRAAKGRRTFTWVHLAEPHDPYDPPPEHRRWRAEGLALDPERASFYRATQASLALHDFEPSVERIAAEIGGYDDEVRYVDLRIRELLEVLGEAGLAETALVALAADHGEGLWTRVAFMTGQRARHVKSGAPPTLFNTLMPTHGNQVNRELVHVPLILRGPGVPAGAVVGEPVENVDLAPTLLELCDLPAPGGLQGRSLVPRLRGQRAAPKPAFSHTRFASSVISAEGLQLILPTDEGRCQEGLEVELYDLPRDPEARFNLAAERPGDVERLSAVVRERLAQGISGGGMKLTAENIAKLHALGYAGDIVEMPGLGAAGAQELVGFLTDPASPCRLRLEAARALRGKPLSEEQRGRLSERLAKEDSAAVRAELEAVLAGR